MCRDCSSRAVSRRVVLAGVGAALAASAVPFAPSRAKDASPAPNAIPPSEALARLKEGNIRYAANEPQETDLSAGRTARVKAQYPIAAVLSCSDSRVPPEVVFDQGPGDLFVVRDAGNVVSTYALASFEFAVKYLGVPLLVVLGHTNCGAVGAALQAAMGRAELPGHLPDLVKEIQPAVITAHGRHPSDLLAVAIEENVRLGMKRLRTESEILSSALAASTVGLAGGVYDLATGKIKFL
jgi:carbonic anhydrase